jgi:DNA-binding XRE family transcriptional regulator
LRAARIRDKAGQNAWSAVGEKISEARRDAGLSQRQLAESLGTSLWTVSELESGKRDPSSYLPLLAGITNTRRLVAVATHPAQPVEATRRARLSSDAARLLHPSGRNLILVSFALLVVIRFFTEKISFVPGVANFVDLPIIFVLVVAVAASRSNVVREGPFFVPAVLFLLVCVVSAVANASRVDIGPTLLFVYGFLGPLVFYYAAYRLWPAGQSLSLSRLIVGLVVLEFVVVLAVDLPKFAHTTNPDDISGTFGQNAYQLVFFLIVGASLIAGIATFEAGRLAARAAPFLLAACFAVIFLAQYRALLATTALSAVLVAALVSTVRGRGLVTGTLLVIACLASLSYVAAHFPVTKIRPTLTAFRASPVSLLRQRLAPLESVATLFGEKPGYIVLGTGPGTFSSRAWRTFARPDTRDVDPASRVASALSGGRRYETDVSRRYTLASYRSNRAILGSSALTSPFSSYTSLLAEVGFLGFILMIGCYVFALVQAGRMALISMRASTRGDPLPAILLATTVAFFVLLQMAALDNWLEVARVTIPAWILLAVGTREFEARQQLARRQGVRVSKHTPSI